MANASLPHLISNSSALGVRERFTNIVLAPISIVMAAWVIVSHSTIFACYVINRSKPWTTYSKQILSLSLNDLCVGIIGLILIIEISMGEDIVPYGVCSVSFYFYFSSLCTNLYHVLAVCIHRAMMLIRDQTAVAPTGTRINALLFLIGWIPAFVLCGIAFALWTEDRGDIRVCVVTRIFGDQQESALAFIMASYLIPLICTNIVYGVTFYKLAARLKRTFPIQTASTNTAISTSETATEKEPGRSPGQIPGQTVGQKSRLTPGQAPGQAKGQAPGHTSGQVPGQTPVQTLGQVPRQTSGQTSGHTSGQVPGQTPVQVPGQTSGQVPGQVPGQTSGQVPGQVPGQTSGQVRGHTSGQASDNAPGQIPGDAPGHAPGQTSGQSPGQSPGQTQGQAPGQSSRQASGHAPGQASATTASNANRTGQAPTTMSSNANRPGMLAQRRATVTIGLLLLFFNLFTLPFIMAMIALVSGIDVDRNIRVSLSNMFVMNSVTSPFVYALRVKNLGQTLKNCIPCHSRH